MSIIRHSIAAKSWLDAQTLTGFAVVFAAASTALPTAWGSLALVLLLAVFLLRVSQASTWQRIGANPPAVTALLLLGVLAVGMTYGAAPLDQAFAFWTKYLKLLALPILIGLAPTPKWRRHALNAALIGVAVSVVVSYLRYAHLIAPFPDPNQAFSGFQNRITFGLYTSVAAYIFASRMALATRRWQKYAYAAAFLLASFDTLAVNSGRTGYVLYLALAVVFFMRHVRRRWWPLSLMVVLAGFSAMLLLSPVSRERLERTVRNAETLRSNDPTRLSSTVLRWQFFRNSLSIVGASPIVGHGTGSFEQQYAQQVAGTNDIETSNPHNDYLLLLTQVGLVGAIFEVLFLVALYRAAKNLSGEVLEWFWALFVTFLIMSALNSTLLDAGEGRFFLILLGIILAPRATSSGDT